MGASRWAWTAGLVLGLASQGIAAEDDPYDDWFLEGSPSNDGELNFLAEPPDYAVHHHKNEFTIDEQSLKDGWVAIRQCHDNLDEIRKIAIVFQEERSRNIRVASYNEDKIGGVEVNGARVILSDVVKGASICIDADSRILEDLGNDTYALKNGPFMRRFFDSYHPMRVSIDVDHEAVDLELVSMEPEEQPGFDVERNGDQFTIDTWFEGRLETEIRLAHRK